MVEDQMRQFRKAPAYVGKPLSLYVRRGNRTIGDNEVLTGDEWARFADMGYLVEVPEAKIVELTEPMKPVSRIMHSHVETVVEPPTKPVEEPVEEPVEPTADPVAEFHEEPKADGTVTKSPFNKPPKKTKR